MLNNETHVFPGLNNSVLDALAAFRQLIDAMSQPGKIVTIEKMHKHPEALNSASYAVVLSMMDQDTDVSLMGGVNTESVRDSLSFHNAISLSKDLTSAAFVICNESERPDLHLLNSGTEAWPDQSCTLIVQCDSFEEGMTYCASGPGIQTINKIRCSALNDSFVKQREKLALQFPLGVDVIFTCKNDLFCLPRTTLLKAELS